MITDRFKVSVCCILMLLSVFWGCGKQAKAPGEKVYLHKVTHGETLSEIAEDYYGNPARGALIGEFNAVDDADLVEGMVLRVPMSGEDLEQLKARERARAPYNRGLELAEKGAYVDAVHEFNDAIAIDPEFVDALYNLGVTLQKMKSYEKAAENLEKAVRSRPRNPTYRFALGNCLFHLGRYEDAAFAFEEVMELDSKHAKALYSLAVCYEKQGQNEKAKRAWERYLELDGKSAWATEARKRLKELE